MFHLRKKIIFIVAAFCLISVGVAPILTVEHAHAEKEGLQAKYHCPMHHQIVSDKPGLCPICHMKLVLINKSMASSSEPSINGLLPVVIDDTARKRLDIQVATVQNMPLKKTIEAWGTIAHDPELYQQQINYLREDRLYSERQRDRTPLSQKRELSGREKAEIEFFHMGLSPEWVKALEESGVPDKRLIYHHQTEGIWVFIQFRENDAALLKKGDLLKIHPTSLQGFELEGRIEFLDSLVNPETRTIRAWVLIHDAPKSLKPNMAVSAVAELNLGETLVIPEDAPLFTGSRAVVFVEKEGVFTPRPVILGIHADAYYEVKDGLMDGEKIAVHGNFFIDSESRLQSTFAGAS
jgi:membrane fusion protein, copper/silver efflux system